MLKRSGDPGLLPTIDIEDERRIMEPVLLPLKQDRPGFENFIGSWLIADRDRNLLIDVGPNNSIDQLISSLETRGVDRVDYILLSHIHADHAGGLGRFLDYFPESKIVCHEKGLPHLISPGRLEAASREVLGDLMDTYGPIRPVPQASLLSHKEAKVEGLTIIETPGHAAHHLSFLYRGHLFAGEAGGIFIEVNGTPYTRPATPPVFFLEKYQESLKRLLAFEDQPLYYIHFGKASSSHEFLKRALDQLLLWEEVIGEEFRKGTEAFTEVCINRLLEKDSCLAAFKDMAPWEKEREILFITHCIQGYVGYFSRNG